MRHYLDHNATAPLRPEVIDIIAETMRHDGNSLSVHEEGRHAHKIVEDAREQVRALVNAPVNSVIFTSGGTESIHYALHGCLRPHNIKRILVSAIEHSAVSANAASTGTEVEIIPARASGVVDLDWLKDRLKEYDVTREGGFLVCLMFANNETGVLQPVHEAADIAHDAGGLLFCDAAQAAGKVPVNFVMSGADMMSLTGHKYGGPAGVGALIAGPNLPLEPVMRGGGHESNRRAGTHNVPAIAGLGLASEMAKQSLARAGEIAALRDRMQDAAISAGAKIWGGDQERLPGTLCLSAPGFSGETQLMTMDLAGIAISAGSACSSGKTKPSHVLTAMGASGDDATSAIRVSLGWNSTTKDADAFIREWPKAYDRIKARSQLEGAA
ncbi:cysteine desulfurase family protein [Hyphococcus sp.]|uniref:cysteine desulfurase family protein n=1 Tax=Hyphococcus sp. TaxID=2038636 RepID=UPI003CCC3005